MFKLVLSVLLCAALFAAANAQTAATSIMGYQSFACRTSLIANSISGMQQNTLNITSPTPANNTGGGVAANEAAALLGTAAAASVQFLYNVVWGPPSYFVAATGLSTLQSPPAANAATAVDTWITAGYPTGVNVMWHATLTTMPANGYPFGCCGGAWPAPVFELGCVNCIAAGAGTPLPALSTTLYGQYTNQRVLCTTCTVPAYSPASSVTNGILAGAGVATLQFPATSNSALAAGVYQFSLWAESICGVQASAPVSIAARCPPSPTVLAVLRLGGNTDSVAPSNAGVYVLPVGVPAYVDASCSFAYQINKPNWPAQQDGISTVQLNNYNPNRNLYAIQSIYFTTTTFGTCLGGGAPPCPTYIRVPSNGQNLTPGSGAGDQWGTPVSFGTQGTHVVVVTATDGCSAAQATITVSAQCTCKPVAKIMAVSTVWSNNPGSQGTNDAAASGNQTPYVVPAIGFIPPTGYPMQDFVPQSLVGYTLSASATDYEVSAVNLAYDFSFFSWAPDYSASFATNGATLKATYLPSAAAAVGITAANSFPPSTAAQCTPASGLAPLACSGTGWWGLSATSCCFSTADIISDIATVVRPTATQTNVYVYKVLNVNNFAPMSVANTPQTVRSMSSGTTWSLLAGSGGLTARIKVYNFMRLGAGCASAAADLGVWTTNMTATINSTGAPTMYYALPMYLRFGANGAQNMQDFNGLPQLNAGAGPAPAGSEFHPTTECGAWLKVTNTLWTTTQTQYKMNKTSVCTGATDLVLCRVTISQANGATAGAVNSYAVSTATLTVSSYGSCKGLWTFALNVDDTCSTASDFVTVNVGCNRAPVVSAGCINTQTWTAAGFDQISLDGRASFDPDNFMDAFDGTASSLAGTYPGCAGTPNACINGGLGTYGLTYAWALLSYSNAAGTLVYPNATVGAPANAGCPIGAAAITQCVNAGCGSTYFYPSVDPVTRMYVLPTGAASAFAPSAQGTLTLGNAWQNGMYGVVSIANGTVGTANTMPVYQAEPAMPTSLTQQRVFPEFNAACAPTVFPIFYSPVLGAANDLFPAGVDGYAYAQQLQHVGNSAYLKGLTMAGTYVARLYAFDGCSVGSADVSFVLECPTLTLNTNNNTAQTFVAGSAAIQAYTPSAFAATYTGGMDVTVTVTITAYPSTAQGAITGPMIGSCSPNQDPVTSPNSRFYQTAPSTSGLPAAGAVGSCNLLYSATSGTYVLVFSATDGCARAVPAVNTLTTAILTVTCPNVVTLATPTPIGSLTFTQPSGPTTSGSFPSYPFTFNASSSASSSDYSYTVAVYWKPSPATGLPTLAASAALGSSVASQFFSGTMPTPGSAVPPTLAPNVALVSISAPATATNNALTAANVVGGARTIQFATNGTNTAATTPITLAARTSFDPEGNAVGGLTFNTASNSGQGVWFESGVYTGQHSNSIYWSGDYYVRVYGGPTTSCAQNYIGSADQAFGVSCGAAIGQDPWAYTAASNQWPAATYFLPGSVAPYFGSSAFFSSSISFCSGSNPYCPGGSAANPMASTNGGFTQLSLSGTGGGANSPYVNGGGSSLSFRIGYKSAAHLSLCHRHCRGPHHRQHRLGLCLPEPSVAFPLFVH